MGRPSRIQVAGGCYYIYLQGNNRQDIFLSNQDRRGFLSLLKGYKERHGLKVYAYCLMPREAHLLIETSSANLSLVMQGFNTSYTKYFNGAHNTVGHVFQGRYKALIVDKEGFLPELTRYVHLQPVRGGGKEKPWRYQWSSLAAYVEAGLKEPLVDSAEVLARFGKFKLKQSVRYLSYVKEGVKSASEFVLPVAGGAAVGGEAFLSRLRAQGALAAPPRPVPVDEARSILSEVAARHGIEEEKLLGRIQWREISVVRRKAIHRIWKETGMGVTELARMFRRTPSAVSQIIRSLESPASS